MAGIGDFTFQCVLYEHVVVKWFSKGFGFGNWIQKYVGGVFTHTIYSGYMHNETT